ncbi:MAG: JAB domain-containing protein, partial [Bacteroidales bacterium]|nr:JAB domain-containing protein [Bacteroidales bacterium]
KGKTHEECWIIYLNRSNRIIGKERISSGGMTETTVDNRVLVRRALEKNACSVILVHNHPSGDPTPGKADISATISLRNALRTCDISLVDHVVVSDDRFYSFADEQIYYK